MKKFLSVFVLAAIFTGCVRALEPLSAHKGNVVVGIRESDVSSNVIVEFKSKDEFYEAEIHKFDAQNLKIGDTVK